MQMSMVFWNLGIVKGVVFYWSIDESKAWIHELVITFPAVFKNYLGNISH